MNGTQNNRYLMQDPYVQGANDPLAAMPGTMTTANTTQDNMMTTPAAQGSMNAAATAQNGMAMQRGADAYKCTSNQG